MHALGQIASDAPGPPQAWLTYNGQQMPSWERVRPDIMAAWATAATAVALVVMQAQHQREVQALHGKDG